MSGTAGLRRRGRWFGTKLNQRQVEVMRSRARAGETQQSIAEDYGVSQTMVSKIVRRERWRRCP